MFEVVIIASVGKLHASFIWKTRWYILHKNSLDYVKCYEHHLIQSQIIRRLMRGGFDAYRIIIIFYSSKALEPIKMLFTRWRGEYMYSWHARTPHPFFFMVNILQASHCLNRHPFSELRVFHYTDFSCLHNY